MAVSVERRFKCEGLGHLSSLFLNDEQPLNYKDEKVQAVLQAIWDISLLLHPSETGTTHVQAPSKRLVELGLVSFEKGHGNQENGGRTIQPEKEDGEINKVTIGRNGKSFVLTETYVHEAGFYPMNGYVAQRNFNVAEVTALAKNPQGGIDAAVKVLRLGEKLHAFGRRWSPDDETTDETQVKNGDTIPTARQINTTLALLIEGIKPGSLLPTHPGGVLA